MKPDMNMQAKASIFVEKDGSKELPRKNKDGSKESVKETVREARPYRPFLKRCPNCKD